MLVQSALVLVLPFTEIFAMIYDTSILPLVDIANLAIIAGNSFIVRGEVPI
jgi:hypothetical protein